MPPLWLNNPVLVDPISVDLGHWYASLSNRLYSPSPYSLHAPLYSCMNYHIHALKITLSFYTTAKICGRIMLWCRRRLVCGHIGFRNLSFDGVNRFCWYFDTLIPSMRYGLGLILGVPAPSFLWGAKRGFLIFFSVTFSIYIQFWWGFFSLCSL